MLLGLHPLHFQFPQVGLCIMIQVIVGVCAMEKKTLSKPMKEILTRLEEFEYIKTCIFPEKVILEVKRVVSIEYQYKISSNFRSRLKSGRSVTVSYLSIQKAFH